MSETAGAPTTDNTRDNTTDHTALIAEEKASLTQQQRESQAFQIWMMAMQQQNALFQSFISYSKQLSNDVKTMGKAQ